MLGCCRFSLTRQPAPRPRRSIMPRSWHSRLLQSARTSEQKDAIFAAWRIDRRRGQADQRRDRRTLEGVSPGGHVDPAPGRTGTRQPPRDPPAGSRQLGPAGQGRPAAHPGRVSSVPGGRAAQSARLRALADRSQVAFDGARGGEPRLAGDLRRGPGRNRRRISARGRPVPEYRELLDWLAVDFMEHGWSQKHLIRTIVTSATYQQSSKASPALLEQRSAESLAGAGAELPGRRGGRARHRLERFGTDHAQARRPERHPARAAECAGLQFHLPGLLEAGGRSRTLPPDALWISQAIDARSGDVELRRAERRFRLRPPRAVEYAARRAGDSERADLRGGRPGLGVAGLARRGTG